MPPPGSDDESYLSSENTNEVEVVGDDSDNTYRGPNSHIDKENSNDELSADDSKDSDNGDSSDEDSIKIMCIKPSPNKFAAMPKRAASKKKCAVLTHNATWTHKARVCKSTSPPSKKRSGTEVSKLVLYRPLLHPESRGILFSDLASPVRVRVMERRSIHTTLVTSL